MTQPTETEFTPAPPVSYRDMDDGPGDELEVRRSDDILHGGKPAYTRYSAEMVSLIGKQIMPRNYQPAELYMVLELAATYQLDPFTKEIWAVRMSDNATEPVTVLVGVEGMKAIARRQSDFRGFRVMEVYEKDDFSYSASSPSKLPDGTWTHVHHDFTVVGDRGALVGAWAEVYRENMPSIFFFADLGEYARTGGKTPWNKQKTAMIRKCALANALRAAYPVSGLYIEEEMGGGGLRNGGVATATEAEADEVGWDDEWREQRVTDLFAALNKTKPNAYLPGKRRLMVGNADTVEARDELLAQLEREIQEAGGELPDPPEFVGEVVAVSGDDDIPFGDEAEDAEVTPVAEGQESLPVDE